MQGLHRIHDEDPTIQVSYVPDTHETIVAGLGERHLEVALQRMERKYGVRAELRRPRVAYRETVTTESSGQGRHKKQTGGRGQFAKIAEKMQDKVHFEFDEKHKTVSPTERGVKKAEEFLGVDNLYLSEHGTLVNHFIQAPTHYIYDFTFRSLANTHDFVCRL